MRQRQKVLRGGYSFIVIAAILILVYLLQVMIPGLTESLLLTPAAFEGEFWRFVTAFFLHGSMGHLLSNLFALLLFGFILESLVGGRNFLIVYFFAGILANMISVFFYPSSLGASGAIYGIIGCVTVLRPTMMIWAFGVIVPMFIAAIFYVLVDFLGIFIPDGVGNIAHLSGIAVGFVSGVILVRGKVFRRGKKDKLVLNEAYMDAWEQRYMR